MSFDYTSIDQLIKEGNIVKSKQYINKEKIVEAVNILEKYCENNPTDYDAQISLAVFISDYPLYDDIRGIEILNKILPIKEYYIRALVVRAEIETPTTMKDDTFQMIEDYLASNPTTAPYYGEMLMHKAFYLRTYNRYDEMEKTLLRSIEISPNFAWNYMLLGDLMFKWGKTKEANKYYKLALEHTTLVDNDIFNSKPYSFEILLDQLLRGVIQWSSNYNRLLGKYEQTKA